ncbi:hypothetical protein Tco_1093725 [Tanacetum coccineum]|uniref:Reverse transcriptase domain-containing protein n=1 Tax=Tanacetum coccineum TaxID=301880 RepID=A0ABQ5IDJ0_9ASTR
MMTRSTIAITPVLPTKEPDNSLSMGEEHLSTIPETESDELIKSSVENLVLIPSESEEFSDIDDTCDVPFCDNSPPLDVLNDHFEIFSDFNNDCTSSDDDSFEDTDYIEASPPDSELVSLEEELMKPTLNLRKEFILLRNCIENDDYESEGDILFLEYLLSNDSPSLHENESFHFDVPSSPRPPAKPPDDGIYF